MVNFPAYAEKIWVQEKAEYLELMMQKDRKRREKEIQKEDE
jgi:hypothetical protein